MLAAVSDVSEWLGTPAPTGEEANRAQLCLDAAADKVESLCGRQFRSVTEPRIFDVPLSQTELLVDDYQTITQVETRNHITSDYIALDTAGYESWRSRTDRPYQVIRRTDGYSWPSGDSAVRVTGTWGWPVDQGGNVQVPPLVKLATIMAAAALFQSNKSPGGDAIGYDGTDLPTLLGYDQRVLQALDTVKSSGRMFG